LSEQGETVDERRKRVGRNEALFRAVNEQIEDLTATFQVTTDEFEIVCECANIACSEQLTVSAAEYERVRSDPTLFILVPGHEDASSEAVVEEDQGDYLVVRKHPGGPADLAAETAPDS
jgi:hypothetical protein